MKHSGDRLCDIISFLGAYDPNYRLSALLKKDQAVHFFVRGLLTPDVAQLLWPQKAGINSAKRASNFSGDSRAFYKKPIRKASNNITNRHLTKEHIDELLDVTNDVLQDAERSSDTSMEDADKITLSNETKKSSDNIDNDTLSEEAEDSSENTGNNTSLKEAAEENPINDTLLEEAEEENTINDTPNSKITDSSIRTTPTDLEKQEFLEWERNPNSFWNAEDSSQCEQHDKTPDQSVHALLRFAINKKSRMRYIGFQYRIACILLAQTYMQIYANSAPNSKPDSKFKIYRQYLDEFVQQVGLSSQDTAIVHELIRGGLTRLSFCNQIRPDSQKLDLGPMLHDGFSDTIWDSSRHNEKCADELSKLDLAAINTWSTGSRAQFASEKILESGRRRFCLDQYVSYENGLGQRRLNSFGPEQQETIPGHEHTRHHTIQPSRNPVIAKTSQSVKDPLSCLNRMAQELPGLKSLEFCEQWPHWRHSLANQNKPLPPVEITDLFPDSSSFLGKRAAAYKQNNPDDALELASRAVALEPQNREALLCLSQIQARLGQPEAAMKTLAGLNPPARPCVSGPIKDMLDHINIARKCLRGDPKSAVEALNKAMGGLASRDRARREWNLIKSEAYLSISPNKARSIAQSLLDANKGDVEALLLAGRASCNLKDYKSATGYFQSAKCYDYKRSDVTERLNTLKTLRGGADGL